VTDTFGASYATTNTGLMYTAKGTAALLVPLGNVLMTATGTWLAVFVIGASMNILAAVLALFVLKPMRAIYTRRAAANPAPAGLRGAAPT
jgi:OFA family oxalate/formate antiporter-like MFS transporter